MKIYTLTLNPAYDIHAFAPNFAPHRENLAQVLSREAGGKGVNISRALGCGKIPNTAVIVLGADNCGDFRQALESSAMDCILLEKPGRIRENLTLHCPDSPETRISFAGFSVDGSILEEVRERMRIDADTVVTFTGRVPSGIGTEQAKAFLKELQSRGARIVLDSKSFSVEDVFELRPWLIKPNQEEISEFFGEEIQTPEHALEKSAAFARHGVVNVMVSLGAQGALLLREGTAWLASHPPVDAVSTIGAGDSTLAGFLAAAYEGRDSGECLKTAVAYGTAACLTPGTLPPEPEALEKIRSQVTLRCLSEVG